MSAEWPLVPLGELVDFRTGKLDSNAAVENAEYPFFTCSPTTLSIDNYSFDTEAVLLAGNNANGIFPVKYYYGKFNAYQRTYVIEPKDREILSTKWLYFRIKHVTNELQQMSIGSATKFLTKKILDAYTIPLPPIASQEYQSKILWDIQNKIDLNSGINQTLEQMAQAIFKSWFVDFEPTKAKMAALEAGGNEDDALLAAMQAIAGSALFASDAADADAATQLARLQTEHPERYATLRATAELFPSAMQESELGEIPEGWDVGTLADFSDLNKNSWTAKTIPEEIDYVDLANTKNGVIESTTKYLSGDAPSRARRKLFNGDTIIGTVRPGNRSFAFIRQPSSNLTGSTGFAVLSPKSPEFAEYIYIAATSDEAINHLAHLADGGAYPAVRSEVVAGITVVVPKSPLLMCFHEMVRPYFDISASLKMGNKTLADLRDTLLPKLLSGELSVSAAADQITKAEEAVNVQS